MISKARHAAVFALLAFAAHGESVSAQREIVQPLPAQGERDLGEALSRLARNAADVQALLDAGEAALELGDIDAATGFFGRANELSPGNARSKLGLAKAYVRSRRPVEALRLFAEAERAGVSNVRMAEDRGLAFDLVGDTASAQQLYRLALANGVNHEITRRLALSLAISGDREGFETALLPLLEQGDVAAFRTRAFGLAILGDAREAKDIANTMLPAGVGARMAAYFEYMPRLTKAQQAAAGNLGVFPRTASIGRDDAGIAGYSGPPAQVARAAAPATGPVSPPAAAAPDPRDRQPRRRPDRTGSRETAPPPATVPDQASPSLSTASAQPTGAATPPGRERAASSEQQSPVVIAAVERAGQPSTVSPPRATPSPPPSPAPVSSSVAEAFNSFTLEPGEPAPAANGAVDITRIEIPRERARPEPPPPPVHPSRHWVQVATGKDRDALKFDWRRIARKADGSLDGKGPFITPWGEANRLLSGPYESAEKAREIVNELKRLNIDSFPFTSAEGEAIDAL
ncbi:SPOR domain-containing protein [Erythrobacter sp.]|uniref:SPOR domain-containing protein n=1 Tax=Erythrobacter sp. TaxID=1042 RepID=UPI001AFD859F|nr:SPOR domain-containing protein [Erythrobacter sp.]MBO6525793.1 tetratricopeptide repeat protein [Erythrobacter sp.]MBO6529532.1 tetratricopeptide repeat protein [Erythrobacter sp.]